MEVENWIRAGIPVAYLTFMVDPPEGWDCWISCGSLSKKPTGGEVAFFYYMGLASQLFTVDMQHVGFPVGVCPGF